MNSNIFNIIMKFEMELLFFVCDDHNAAKINVTGLAE